MFWPHEKESKKKFKLHTKTVATLFGKAFARIEDDAVMAAPKPMASTILTRKHMTINMGPSGSWSKTLKKNTIVKCQTGSNFLMHSAS